MNAYLPLLIALATLLLSGGLFFAALIGVRNARREIERRVAMTRANAVPAAGPLPLVPGRASWLDTRVRAAFAMGMARQWAMTLGAVAIVGFGSLAAGVAWLVVGRSLGAPLWFSLPLAALAFAFLPRLLLQREQSKAEAQFLSLFPDAIDMMVRMLRAGLPVTAAIRTIGAEAPSPVDSVFRGVADQVDIGIPLEGALTQTAAQIGLGDFRFFAVAVALQRATGGNLAATLETLADIMRKRRAMRLKARSATAEVRLSAYVLGAMPFFIIAILLVLRPNYLVPLIADPRGNIIVGIAVTLLMLAFVSMRRMMRSIDAAVGGRSR